MTVHSQMPKDLMLLQSEINADNNVNLFNQIFFNQIKEGFIQKFRINIYIQKNFHFPKTMSYQNQINMTRKKLENYSYQLNSHIGKGYSSQVFKGRNDITNQNVAIKVIDMKMIKGEVHKNLLASEIQVLKSLKNCENIIQVFDIYTTKNNTYIITELCDEGDLAKVITNKKIFPEHEAIEIMNQVITGYNEISNRGIIHRDLKPANIFLRNKEVKIADFGFAMKNCQSKKYSSYNVGSPIYMPPEALNDNKYSFKSDIWALGIIYYEMLTGKTPWRAKTEKQLGKQLLSVPIQKLLPKGINQSSIDFLTKTLNISINERMCPQELQRFSFTFDKVDKQSTRGDLVSSNSISDTKSFLLKSSNRNETSLNRNTVNTPKNLKRFNFLKNTCQDMKELKQIKNVSMSKGVHPHSSMTKTEYLISPTANQNFNPTLAFTSTQKQLSNFRSTNNITIIDKKLLSKHLLSQIHFCRFLYKLLTRICDKLSEDVNNKFNSMKQKMCGLIFYKLQEIESLKLLTSIQKKQYKETSDYTKIIQIVNQYQTKYKQDLSYISRRYENMSELRNILNEEIIFLHYLVFEKNPSDVKEQVIVLDYLITLRQLLLILQDDNIQNFHNKAKIQQIVQGSPAHSITSEHISAISSKLKILKML